MTYRPPNYYDDNPRNDAPEANVLSEKDVTARKAHHCSWCPHLITAGSRYRRIALIEDGKFQFLRIHLSHFYGGPDE